MQYVKFKLTCPSGVSAGQLNNSTENDKKKTLATYISSQYLHVYTIYDETYIIPQCVLCN